MSEDGGDDSPPRPKRKIKRVMIVSSASESESDESVAVPGTRRKRLRVLSDEESSDSSESSVVVTGVRRRRALPKLRDSDAESEGSGGWVTDSDAGKPAAVQPKQSSGFASDSSEGNSDKCSICLLRFTDQETGTPENCEHVFCFDCITEWSKNVNTCPVDRITFKSIIVRACMGGRVLRTEEVKVTERRPSMEMFVFEDITTHCEICSRSDNEDTMLLCDSCDLGYHMHCLTPPLTQIPLDQWLCPNCDDLLEDAIHISEVDELFSDMVEVPEGPRPSALRAPRRNVNVRRSTRNSSNTEQPSTSTGRRRANTQEVPTTSRASRTSRPSSSSSTRQRQQTSTKRRRKRRKAKTIVIEYEIEENGKFPITKRVTRRLKKRKSKRQPRTVARRTHVRASVRARLASIKADQRVEIMQSANAAVGVQNLAIQRHRAGIPSLSLMGNPNQLEYFSDEENHISEAATTAVATRPTANILSAYRQARRKMIAVPSPPHASSAPDILSNILESQTLLHSKKSLVSIAVDGNINIKLLTHSKQDRSKVLKEEKVDLNKAEAATKKAPTYPGQSRGGGGWGGGYRGSYPREHQQNNSNFGRGGNYEGNYGGNYHRPGQNFNNFQGNMRREEPEYFDTFPRRPHQFPLNDEPQSYSDRQRRAPPLENSRGPNFGPPPPHFQRNNDQGPGRHSLNSSWPTYGGPASRSDAPPPQPRHSFGGFENPVDMRVSQAPSASEATADYSSAGAPRQDKRPPPTFQSLPDSQQYRPLARPPTFNYPKVPDVEKSEDERSDSGLVIDTEKYDPTEPTNDDDSGDDDRARPRRAAQPPAPLVVTAPAPADTPPALPPSALPPPSHQHPSLPPPTLQPSPALLPNQVQTILAGIDTSGMNVPLNVLDDAVRQVLKEHRSLMANPSTADDRRDRSDEDSDGDCPNFSIYSATSVHIASNTDITDDITNQPNNRDDLADLVQEDDDAVPAPPPAPPTSTAEKKHDPKITHFPFGAAMTKTEEEYKEKVSKRCPITTVTRNPIKIKLNTPSLIKRQVSLYDEEEASWEPEEAENPTNAADDNAAGGGDAVKTTAADDSDKNLDGSTDAHFKDTFTRESPKIIESPRDKETERESGDDDDKRDRLAAVEEEEEKSNCASKRSDGVKTPNSLDNSNARDDPEARSDDSRSPSRSPRDRRDVDKEIDNVEKMTESISETEDERSYTPCLDENKSTKDASFDNDKDKGLEGLDTEMISEDDGNEMFSENEDARSDASRRSPARPPAHSEEGEIPDKKKERKRSESREESVKKKKKKESKKEGKEKSRSKKRSGDVAFKKLSKSGKERNYRDRDKDDKKDRERRSSAERHKKRREKRKDLERYDVRTVVTEKRRKLKDPFGRDVSPRGRSTTRSPASPAHRRSPALRSPPRSLSPARRRSPSPRRSPAFSRGRRSPSPPHPRRSPLRARRSLSRPRRSPSRGRKSPSRGRKSPSRPGRSPSPVRRTISRSRRSPARRSPPRRVSPARARSASRPRRRRSASSPRASPRRRSPARRKRRRSAGASPPRKASKKKKRPRSAARRASPAAPRRRSPSPPTVRPPSPRTPPSPAERELSPRPRADRPRRRPRDAPPPSKEVFTSGDNILVSVSFKEQERGEDGERRKRKEARRTRRKRRRAPVETEAAKPVAIIDLDRSPFRELTPSPKNVIVLSDSDHGEKEPAAPAAPPPEPAEPAPEPAALGPQTPPEPAAPEPEPAPAPAPPDVEDDAGSPDAYDPFEPTRSASASPARAGSPGAPSPPSLTLEAAQRSNLSADEVLARRPLSPAEKVLALLQSQRAAEPEPPPEPPRPEPPRSLPKLFPGKPSPIKSNPVKPMQAARLPWPPSDAGASPYSPGSSDFGELFEPPRTGKIKPHKKRGGKGALDEDNLKILDEVPSSAVALQVKNKFLKKLNRQERVVEEVKLVLKPHYNRRRVSKDDYKEILRRCVPKICHNKTGEINPTKIQALVEAYVKKFRKKRKLGIA